MSPLNPAGFTSAERPFQAKGNLMVAEPDVSVPQMLCCQCHQRMQVYLQRATEDDDAAYFVTCGTAWCVMGGHTLSAAHYPPQNLAVYLRSSAMSPVLQLYLSLVAQESPAAAVAVEQIRWQVGAGAALRAALVLTIFRMEVRQNHRRPDLGVYAYLMRDYPTAMHGCQDCWNLEDRGWARSRTPRSDERRLRNLMGSKFPAH